MTTLDHSPDDILRRAVIQLGLGTDPVTTEAGQRASLWPVYAVNKVDKPDQGISVTATAGIQGSRTQNDGEWDEFLSAQIAVRSKNHTSGWAKVQAIKDALDGLAARYIVSLGSNRYLIWNLSRRGGIIQAGKEPGSERYLFTLNYLASIEQRS